MSVAVGPIVSILSAKLGQKHNNSLQVTFAPPRTFASAKAHVAANAPELRRYVPIKHGGNSCL